VKILQIKLLKSNGGSSCSSCCCCSCCCAVSASCASGNHLSQEGLLSAEEIDENALAPRELGEGVLTDTAAAAAAAAAAVGAAVVTVTGDALPAENVLLDRGGVALAVFAALRATLRAAADGGDAEFSLSWLAAANLSMWYFSTSSLQECWCAIGRRTSSGYSCQVLLEILSSLWQN
jgi:hypothetical protein